MLGDAKKHSSMVRQWLLLLEKYETGKLHGQLIAKNLEEDLNVPAARVAEFVERLEKTPLPATPEEAQQAINEIATTLFPCDAPANKQNIRDPSIFNEATRVIPMVNFIEFNSPKGIKATIPIDKEDLLCDSMELDINAPDFDPKNLRGDVGYKYAFTTDTMSLLGADRSASPEEIRDRLGLDYAKFGAGHRLVFLFYDLAIPATGCYKPTVLDAPAHHPFLPSNASSPTGFTQHLVTGEPDVPELIHCAFPAAKIRGAMASMRLKNDPPESYKVRRLP